MISLDELDAQELYRIMDGNTCITCRRLDDDPLQLNVVIGGFVPRAIVFIPLKYQDQHVGIAILLAQKDFSRSFDDLEKP